MQVHSEARQAEAVRAKGAGWAPTASSTAINTDVAIVKAGRNGLDHWMGGVVK